jgi:hypothetical protein
MLATVNPNFGDRRKVRKPGTNRAGGLASMAKLTPKQQSEKARNAALALYARAKVAR